MASHDHDAHKALDAVEEMRELNTSRLRLPRSYWAAAGVVLCVITLAPYTSELPSPLDWLAPLGLVLLTLALVSKRKPSAGRKYRLSERMILEVCGFGLAVGIIVAISHYADAEPGLWWVPAACALLVLAFTFFAGTWMERSWSRRVSYAQQ